MEEKSSAETAPEPETAAQKAAETRSAEKEVVADYSDSSTTDVEENLTRINYLIEFLKSKEEIPSQQISLTSFVSRAASFPLAAIFSEVKALEKKAQEIGQLSSRLGNLYREIEPLAFIDAPLRELGEKEKTAVTLYRVESGRISEILENSERASVHAVCLAKKRRSAVVFLAYRREDTEKAKKIVMDVNAEEILLPAYRTPAAETLSRIKRIFERNNQRLTAVEEKKEGLRRYLREISGLYDIYQIKKAELEVRKRIYETDSIAVFSGWVRRKDRQSLMEKLKSYFPKTEIMTRKPREDETVPVAFENSPVGRPFEAVVDLYGRTYYQGTDPSIYLAFFFTLSFAFCLADVGYGLTLLIISLLLMRRLKEQGAQKMLKVFASGGIAASVAGLITNSWFGNLFSKFPGLSGLSNLQARLTLISPVDNPQDTMRLFYFSILFGYIQITTGVILKLKEAVRRFGASGILENGPPLILQLGIPLLVGLFVLRAKFPTAALYVPWTAAILALATILIIYNQWRSHRDLTLRLFWSSYAIYGLVVGNLIGDVLSYARIFALGLTSGLLAVTVNQLAVMSKSAPMVGPVLLILILLIGHSFNLFISTLGAYVHTSRLQYLEFFTKFYDSGGKPFNPLRKQLRYLRAE